MDANILSASRTIPLLSAFATCLSTLVKSSSRMWRWIFFFFSSRRRHTRFDCDWSSDVCSSDLLPECRRSAGLAGLLQPQLCIDMRKTCLQLLYLGFEIDHALGQGIAACACCSGGLGHGVHVHGAAQQMRPALLACAKIGRASCRERV